MKIKIFIIIPIITITVCSICLIILSFFISKNKNTNDVVRNADVIIKDRSDLTELLGYDFEDANIYSIHTSNECLCVILNDDFATFSNDKFVKNEAYAQDDGGFFDWLKKTFPNVFVMNFSDIKNNNLSAKDYVFSYKEYDAYHSYYIEWFTAEIEDEERIVIYAFLPDEIKTIKVAKNFS